MEIEDVVDRVRDCIDGEGWRSEYNAENKYIRMSFSLECKLKNIAIFIEFKEHGYIVYGICPINGDKDNLGEMLRYVTMANYGLLNGNFEACLQDGEIRYKCWVPTLGLTDLSKEIVVDSVVVPCLMMDRFGDGIAALAMGFSDAQTEIDKVFKHE